MTSLPNLTIYRFWAPVYDRMFGPITLQARGKAVMLMNLQPGQRLLIPGVGTGLDLPLIPAGVQVTAGDISEEMLKQVKGKAVVGDVDIRQIDAQHLEFPVGSFDAVLFSLLLSVVPDPQTAFGEAWRVLQPGGLVAIFDKFIPEGNKLTPFRNFLGLIIRFFGTDPNRRLSEIIEGCPGQLIQVDEPSLLGGQYRIVLIEKAA